MSRSDILQVRLGVEAIAELKRRAHKLGLKSATYARTLLVQALAQLKLPLPKPKAKR